MTLEEVKIFLRVDFDEDDAYIRLLMDVAKEYIINAVGVFNEKRMMAKLLFLTIISNLYENRQYTVESNEKVAYIIKSMVLQLQLEEDDEDIEQLNSEVEL